MAYAFYLGIDVTAADAPDATLTLVEKSDEQPGGEPADEPMYHIRQVERVEGLAVDDDDPVEDFVDHVQTLLANQSYTGRTLVSVNQTNAAGQAVLHALSERGLTPVGFTITDGESAAQEGTGVELSGGDSAVPEASSFYASEMALAERLLMLERTGRLRMEQGNTGDHASSLAHGLRSYRADLDAAEATEGAETLGEAEEAEGEPGQVDTQGESAQDAVDVDDDAATDRAETPALEAAHDPFVISAGLACYLAEERSFDPTEHLTGAVPTTGEAKREHRPDVAE